VPQGRLVQVLRGFGVAQQGQRARPDAQRPVAARGAGRVGQAAHRFGGPARLARPDRGLDQLGGRPRAQDKGARVPDGRLGRRQGQLILAQAVVQHGGRPFRGGDPQSRAAQHSVVPGALDQRERRIRAAAQGGQPELAVGGGTAAGRFGCLPGFAHQRLRRGQVAAQQLTAGEDIEGQRQVAERPLLAGQPDEPAGQRVPGRVIPQGQRAGAGQRQPAQFFRGQAAAKPCSAWRRIGTPAAWAGPGSARTRS
jgi:hypothetical protein